MSKLQALVALLSFVIVATGIFVSILFSSPATNSTPALALLKNQISTVVFTAPEEVNQQQNNNVVLNTPVTVNTSNQNANTTKPTNISTNKNTNTSVIRNSNTARNKNLNIAINTHTNTTTNVSTNSSTNTSTNVSVNLNTNTTANLNTNISTNQNTNTSHQQPGEIWLSNIYNTGYGWPDNTPPGSAISNPVIHTTNGGTAGGVGTFQDPITLAVGHSITNGVDTLDFPSGTKFYIPALRRYFIVEDTCGDGNRPQDGPCHISDEPNTIQLDLWVGGQGSVKQSVDNCESKITGIRLAIQNPASNYTVVSGAIYNGACSQLYGDSVVTQ